MNNAHPLNDIGKEALLHNVLFRSSPSTCVKNIVLWTPSTRSETIDILRVRRNQSRAPWATSMRSAHGQNSKGRFLANFIKESRIFLVSKVCDQLGGDCVVRHFVHCQRFSGCETHVMIVVLH